MWVIIGDLVGAFLGVIHGVLIGVITESIVWVVRNVMLVTIGARLGL